MIIIFIIHYITLDTRKSYTALYLFVKTLMKITALNKNFSFFLILWYEIWNAKKKKKSSDVMLILE